MGLVIAENFDNVTVPALPSDVTAFGTVVTSTSQHLSGAKSVNATSGSAALSSSAPDNSSGNCTVTGSVYWTGSTSYDGIYLCVGSNGNINSASNNGYVIYSNTTGDLQFNKWVSGTYSSSFFAPGNGTVTTGIWYTITLVRNANKLWMIVQRQSDLFWLNGSVWQAAYAANGPYTDASPLASTPSFGGFLMLSSGVYGDNLQVYDQKFNFPTGPLKGMVVVPAASLSQTDWYQVWGSFINTSPGGIQAQIALAKSAKCNIIRIVGGLEGVYFGQYTVGTYLSRLSQIINYCKSLGLYFYLSEGIYAPYFAPGDPTREADIFSGAIANLVLTAQVLAGYSNVFAFDLVNEFSLSNYFTLGNGTVNYSNTYAMTTAQWQKFFTQAISAIRAVAPNLALTSDFPAPGLSAPFSTYCYLFDLIDTHMYYPTGGGPASGAANTAIYGSAGTSGKSIFASEMGDSTNADTTVNVQSTLTAFWNNFITATYPSNPGCLGGCWWGTVPWSGGVINPMFDSSNPGVAAAYEPQYQGYSAPTFSFGSNFRRRRR